MHCTKVNVFKGNTVNANAIMIVPYLPAEPLVLLVELLSSIVL